MNIYVNYDLWVSQMGDNYHLRADCPLAGQERGVCYRPFSDEEIQELFLQEMTLTPKEIGQQLYDAIFQKNIGVHLRTCLSTARAKKDNLRIRLHLNESSQLALLPWEYLYDTVRNDFFALSIQTPIVRYIDMSIAESSIKIEEPLHILVMIADPLDMLPRLDVDREWILLRAAFQDLEDAGKIRLHRLTHAHKLDLQRYLRGNRIDIFHFIGHGYFDEQSGEGNLIFEDNQRQAESVSADMLARLLKDRMPRLVYLNSCDTAQTGYYDPLTGTAQRLVQHGIPAVVAMQSTIQDEKAIQIAHEFYLALTDGYPVDAALAEGRKAVFSNDGLSSWGTPVLFMRAPDGILWDHRNSSETEVVLAGSQPSSGSGRRASSTHTERHRLSSWTRSKRFVFGALGVAILLATLLFAANYGGVLSTKSEESLTPTVTSMSTLESTNTLAAKSTPTPANAIIDTVTPQYVTMTPTSIPEPTHTSSVEPATGPAGVKNEIDCTQTNEMPQSECEALVALYQNTKGPNGHGQSSWLAADTLCDGKHVICQNGNVVQLYLMGDWNNSFGLTGDLPPEIGNLVHLDVLHLYGNELRTVPPEIGKLAKLGVLNLGRNQLILLPKEIGNLAKLHSFYVSSNQLRTLPTEIGKLAKLGWLSIAMNPLESVPTELWQLSRLVELDLRENRLDVLPAGIGNLGRLQALLLANNNLETLPAEIGNLVGLERLYLNNNQFSTWPVVINTFSYLTEITLDDNFLKTLPAEINALSNLETLNLDGNNLQTLPAEIGQLLQLKELHLSDNNLQTLPPEIGSLTNLTVLDISSNLLKELPADIGNLASLKHLCPNDNQLTTLPVSFAELTSVEDLKLEGNRLEVTEPTLLAWMDAKDPDWADNQR